MTEERKLYYLMKFDELIDGFDEDDSVSVEDAYAEMHKHWTHYLNAGCDVNKVVKMMSPMDIFKNYTPLRAKGASIDISDLAEDVRIHVAENFDDQEYDEFVQENLVWFLKHGLPTEEIADFIPDCYDLESFIYRNFDMIKGHTDLKILSKIILNCYDEMGLDYARIDVNKYEEYTGKGLDIILLAEYAIQHGLDYCGDEFVIDFCDKLKEKGASEELIKQFFDLLDGYFYYNVFTHNRIDWLKTFVDSLDLGAEKVAELLDEGDSCYNLEEMPEEVFGLVARKWYGKMSIREFDLNACEYGSLHEFLRATGFDVDFIVEKFLKEDGYENCVDCWLPYVLFQEAPTKIDPEKVVQKMLEDNEDTEILEDYYNVMKKLGVDEKIIAPLLKD